MSKPPVLTKIIGIDPGLNGALVVHETTKGLVAIIDMPTIANDKGKRRISESILVGLLQPHAAECEMAVLEEVGARPGQGVSSMFNFGVSYGLIRGVLAGLHIPVTTVRPAKWMKDMRLTGGKGGSRLRAAELYPAYASHFSRVKDDGRADAALLARWGLIFFARNV